MEASNPIKRCFCGGFEVPQSGATKLQCDRRSCPRRLIGRGSWRETLPKLLELHNDGKLDSAFPGLDIHGLTAHVARKYAAHGPSELVRVDKFHQNPKQRFQVPLKHFLSEFRKPLNDSKYLTNTDHSECTGNYYNKVIIVILEPCRCESLCGAQPRHSPGRAERSERVKASNFINI